MNGNAYYYQQEQHLPPRYESPPRGSYEPTRKQTRYGSHPPIPLPPNEMQSPHHLLTQQQLHQNLQFQQNNPTLPLNQMQLQLQQHVHSIQPALKGRYPHSQLAQKEMISAQKEILIRQRKKKSSGISKKKIVSISPKKDRHGDHRKTKRRSTSPKAKRRSTSPKARRRSTSPRRSGHKDDKRSRSKSPRRSRSKRKDDSPSRRNSSNSLRRRSSSRRDTYKSGGRSKSNRRHKGSERRQSFDNHGHKSHHQENHRKGKNKSRPRQRIYEDDNDDVDEMHVHLRKKVLQPQPYSRYQNFAEDNDSWESENQQFECIEIGFDGDPWYTQASQALGNPCGISTVSEDFDDDDDSTAYRTKRGRKRHNDIVPVCDVKQDCCTDVAVPPWVLITGAALIAIVTL
mmetsp:Transcript_22467/g.27538  ORF Transcript_22467/g.27538 Transcript_22467/m.27538 type:complete len:400 (+) Transcript_22467:116-1315(+)